MDNIVRSKPSISTDIHEEIDADTQDRIVVETITTTTTTTITKRIHVRDSNIDLTDIQSILDDEKSNTREVVAFHKNAGTHVNAELLDSDNLVQNRKTLENSVNASHSPLSSTKLSDEFKFDNDEFNNVNEVKREQSSRSNKLPNLSEIPYIERNKKKSSKKKASRKRKKSIKTEPTRKSTRTMPKTPLKFKKKNNIDDLINQYIFPKSANTKKAEKPDQRVPNVSNTSAAVVDELQLSAILEDPTEACETIPESDEYDSDLEKIPEKSIDPLKQNKDESRTEEKQIETEGDRKTESQSSAVAIEKTVVANRAKSNRNNKRTRAEEEKTDVSDDIKLNERFQQKNNIKRKNKRSRAQNSKKHEIMEQKVIEEQPDENVLYQPEATNSDQQPLESNNILEAKRIRKTNKKIKQRRELLEKANMRKSPKNKINKSETGKDYSNDAAQSSENDMNKDEIKPIKNLSHIREQAITIYSPSCRKRFKASGDSDIIIPKSLIKSKLKNAPTDLMKRFDGVEELKWNAESRLILYPGASADNVNNKTKIKSGGDVFSRLVLDIQRKPLVIRETTLK